MEKIHLTRKNIFFSYVNARQLFYFSFFVQFLCLVLLLKIERI